eukprot:50882-Pyramimonas_sp.AAC.1
MCASSALLFYNVAAERQDYRPTSILMSTTTRGMNTARKTFHTSSYVEGLPYVKMTSDCLDYENNWL